MHRFGKNEAANLWRAERPEVDRLGALVLARIPIALGASALMTGKENTNRGSDLGGGQAKLMAVVGLVFGSACLVYGVAQLLG